MSKWWNYVQRVTGSATQQAIADKTGISQSSIARWRNGTARPESVVVFARSYGRPTLEALVEADIVPAEDVTLTEVPADSIGLPTPALAAEVSRLSGELARRLQP